MKTITLNCGRAVMVDDSDHENLSRFKWSFHKYVMRSVYIGRSADGKSKTTSISMHTQIMNPPSGMEVDHRDRNPLNNQRDNLRICTEAQNKRNRKKNSLSKHQYKGVRFRNNAYEASIKFNHNSIYLGRFKTPEAAATEYNKKAVELFGEFANLNEIKEN